MLRENVPAAPVRISAQSLSATFPQSLTRWTSVWMRNFLVWRKLAIPSAVGNLADPMIYRS
jgi:lipooligosaccharide transport system permease protein